MQSIRTIIGIAGASGAGKSRLAQELLTRLKQNRTDSDVAILHEDSYYRQRDELTMEQREGINYDHPDAFEHDLLIDQLRRMRNGESVEVPIYDYQKHNRDTETFLLKPPKVLILEGILLLHCKQLRDLLDLKVFVDVPLDICLSRRIERDTVERGRSIKSVLSQYHRTVRPMFFQFIDPSKSFADLIIPRGGENFAAIEVLENHLEQLL